MTNRSNVDLKRKKAFPVITLHQPYASLIASGEKEYETRHWQPGSLRRGDILLIHAGKANGRQQRDLLKFLESRFPDAIQKARDLHDMTFPKFPLGMIVCAVRYHGAFRVESIRDGLSEKERAFGNYKYGRWAWKLEVLRVPDMPIAATGKQGIWKWKADVTLHD